MKYTIKDDLEIIVKLYLNNQITLSHFENYILDIIKYSDSEILYEILEDIAYTTTGILSDEDKQLNLMSETDLKSKLRQYFTNI